MGSIFFVLGTLFLFVGLAIVYLLEIELDAMQWEVLIGPAIFAFIGLIFALIGGGILLSQRRERMRKELLMRTGRKIEARIIDFKMNTSIKVNNRHPYKITCTANVSGKDREFVSGNIFGSLLLNLGDKVDVFLDFRNYDNYWVEIPADAVRK